MIKKALLIIALLILIIQIFKTDKNISTTRSMNAIEEHYPVPKQIGTLLQNSCYDCHSNNTVYPWYSSIQPFDWWLNSHITEGKQELNFDDFNSYDVKKKKHKLDEIIEVIQKNKMPLSSYTLVHKKAIISNQEKEEIIAWAKGLKNTIK